MPEDSVAICYFARSGKSSVPGIWTERKVTVASILGSLIYPGILLFLSTVLSGSTLGLPPDPLAHI